MTSWIQGLESRIVLWACPKRWVLAIMMNVIMIAGLVCLAEVMLRVGVERKVLGEEFGGRLLYPRQWKRVVSLYQAVIRKAQLQPTYTVPDKTLGWTIGVNRSSENGLYVSSTEGLQTAQQGVPLRDRTAACRIAVVGDSNAFAEYVVYERTWVHLLEKALGGTEWIKCICGIRKTSAPGRRISSYSSLLTMMSHGRWPSTAFFYPPTARYHLVNPASCCAMEA